MGNGDEKAELLQTATSKAEKDNILHLHQNRCNNRPYRISLAFG